MGLSTELANPVKPCERAPARACRLLMSSGSGNPYRRRSEAGLFVAPGEISSARLRCCLRPTPPPKGRRQRLLWWCVTVSEGRSESMLNDERWLLRPTGCGPRAPWTRAHGLGRQNDGRQAAWQGKVVSSPRKAVEHTGQRRCLSHEGSGHTQGKGRGTHRAKAGAHAPAATVGGRRRVGETKSRCGATEAGSE